MSIKKLFLIVALVFTGTTAHSQVLLSLVFGDKLNSDGLEFGLEGGVNWSDVSTLGTKSLANFNLGFYFDIRLKNNWRIDTGVLVKSTLGTNNLTDEDLNYLGIVKETEPGSYSQEISYFIVPILLKYNFKNRIYVEGGPQLGWMRDAYVEFNHESDAKDIQIQEFNKDMLNRIDAGLTVGTGYKLRDDNGMTLGVKYYYGLVDVYKTRSGTNNSAFFLKLNVPIGAEKAKVKPKKENN